MNQLNVLILLAVSATIHAIPERLAKHVGLFNYITFPNDGCLTDGSLEGTTANLNGNCYTKQECEVLRGTAAGLCAEGYGVCCVFRPACGETTSRYNISYLIQDKTLTPAKSVCTYTICPCSSGINRIRLDFHTFIIANPLSLSASQQTGTATGTSTVQSVDRSIGDCVEDTFSVSSTKKGYEIKGSPVICGYNTGQHMVVDTDGEVCITAGFNFGVGTFTREYEIRVQQYDRRNALGGPPGCLQFYVRTTARVVTFNWNENEDIQTGTRTHLTNQNYNVCIRRERGFCGICWIPTIYGVANMDAEMFPNDFTMNPQRGSFGLSLSPTTDVRARNGADCTDDYIVIPNGEKRDRVDEEGNLNVPVWQILSNNIEVGIDRYCGRFLNVDGQDAAENDDNTRGDQHDECVCSRVTPFTLTVVTDGKEVFGTGDANEKLASEAFAKADDNEASADDAANAYPLGTMGFSLDYTQQICP